MKICTPFSYVSQDVPGGTDLATEEQVEWAKSAKHKAEGAIDILKRGGASLWEPVHLP